MRPTPPSSRCVGRGCGARAGRRGFLLVSAVAGRLLLLLLLLLLLTITRCLRACASRLLCRTRRRASCGSTPTTSTGTTACCPRCAWPCRGDELQVPSLAQAANGCAPPAPACIAGAGVAGRPAPWPPLPPSPLQARQDPALHLLFVQQALLPLQHPQLHLVLPPPPPPLPADMGGPRPQERRVRRCGEQKLRCGAAGSCYSVLLSARWLGTHRRSESHEACRPAARRFPA